MSVHQKGQELDRIDKVEQRQGMWPGPGYMQGAFRSWMQVPTDPYEIRAIENRGSENLPAGFVFRDYPYYPLPDDTLENILLIEQLEKLPSYLSQDIYETQRRIEDEFQEQQRGVFATKISDLAPFQREQIQKQLKQKIQQQQLIVLDEILKNQSYSEEDFYNLLVFGNLLQNKPLPLREEESELRLKIMRISNMTSLPLEQMSLPPLPVELQQLLQQFQQQQQLSLIHI